MSDERVRAGVLECPDGSKFVMYTDGSWEHLDRDGGWSGDSGDEDGPYEAFDPHTAWTPGRGRQQVAPRPLTRRAARRGEHIRVLLKDGSEVVGYLDGWGPNVLRVRPDDEPDSVRAFSSVVDLQAVYRAK